MYFNENKNILKDTQTNTFVGSMPRVMETANSNFYSDITWPLPRLPSGQERPGMFFSISDDF